MYATEALFVCKTPVDLNYVVQCTRPIVELETLFRKRNESPWPDGQPHLPPRMSIRLHWRLYVYQLVDSGRSSLTSLSEDGHHFYFLLWKYIRINSKDRFVLSSSYLLRTPPSNEAFRHSGGDKRLWTSAIVTLYLDVLESRLRRPGTAQNTSLGEPEPMLPTSFPLFIPIRNRNERRVMVNGL